MDTQTADRPKRRKADLRTEIRNEAEAAAALIASIRDVIEGDEDALQDAIEGETNLKEAISDGVSRCFQVEAFADAIDNQIAKLKARKQRLENQAELIRTAILLAMDTAEVDKLELPAATLTVKATAPKAVVIDEAQLPSKFFKTVPKLALKDLTDALKAGEKIPGAELSNGGQTLQIRGG